jgi:hypothetical protein
LDDTVSESRPGIDDFMLGVIRKILGGKRPTLEAYSDNTRDPVAMQAKILEHGNRAIASLRLFVKRCANDLTYSDAAEHIALRSAY